MQTVTAATTAASVKPNWIRFNYFSKTNTARVKIKVNFKVKKRAFLNKSQIWRKAIMEIILSYMQPTEMLEI